MTEKMFEIISSMNLDEASLDYKIDHIYDEVLNIVKVYVTDSRDRLILYKESDGNKEYWDKYEYNHEDCLTNYTNSLGLDIEKEYDDRMNCIRSTIKGGLEYIAEYDNDNLVHLKTSEGFEYWRIFDRNDDPVYYKNSNGFEEWYIYDSNHNLTYQKMLTNYQLEIWSSYDSKNRLVYEKFSTGLENWYKYDKEDKLILVI